MDQSAGRMSKMVKGLGGSRDALKSEADEVGRRCGDGDRGESR